MKNFKGRLEKEEDEWSEEKPKRGGEHEDQEPWIGLTVFKMKKDESNKNENEERIEKWLRKRTVV